MAFTQWAAGMKITAARLAGMTPKYKSYTPTWTTSTGSNVPSWGNAVRNCRWSQSGDLVSVQFDITFGTTTNFGGGSASDNWIFGLPVAAASTAQYLGWLVTNATTATAFPIVAIKANDTGFYLGAAGGSPGNGAMSGGFIDLNTPATGFWANTSIAGNLIYEAA